MVCVANQEKQTHHHFHIYFYLFSCPTTVIVKDGNVITTLFKHESRTHTGCPTQAWTLSVSSLNRRPPKNDKMFEIRPLDFLHAIWDGQIFFSSSHRVETLKTLPFLSGHLKFIKCGSLITFTHTAFDLLSLNYHKAVQRRPSLQLLLCATVIAFLILGGEEYWYSCPGLISH